MASIINTRRIAKELEARGLLPPRCRFIDIHMDPSSALVIRYEVFVDGEQLSLVADALKAAAGEGLADDERNRLALANK